MKHPKDSEEIPSSWAELRPDQRKMLLAMANDRLWWEGAKVRLKRLGPWVSWITVVIGGMIFFKDHVVSFAAWIASVGNTKP